MLHIEASFVNCCFEPFYSDNCCLRYALKDARAPSNLDLLNELVTILGYIEDLPSHLITVRITLNLPLLLSLPRNSEQKIDDVYTVTAEDAACFSEMNPDGIYPIETAD